MPVTRDDVSDWWRLFHSVAIVPRLNALVLDTPNKKYVRRQIELEAGRRVIAAMPHVDDVNELAGPALSVFDNRIFVKGSPYYQPK